MIDDDKASAIVDVRSPLTQAATGRIPGARDDRYARTSPRASTACPPDDEVVVYCACPNEATAVKVAQQLRKLGFKRDSSAHGGIDAWIGAGHEVER